MKNHKLRTFSRLFLQQKMHLLSRLLGILQTEMRDFATLLIPEAQKLKLPLSQGASLYRPS